MRIRIGPRAFVLTLATVAVPVATAAYLLRDPLPHFLARRSRLAGVVIGTRYSDRGYQLQQVRLMATSGLLRRGLLLRAVWQAESRRIRQWNEL